MSLTNFGAIMNFAETVERDDMEFYDKAATAMTLSPDQELFAALSRENRKNISLVLRTRRENVTEMILEPIQDFTCDSYRIIVDDVDITNRDGLLTAANTLEDRAIRYYTDAANKIRALPEVARILKNLAKKHRKRLARLKDL